MNFAEFCQALSGSSAKSLEITIPGAGALAPHFHITEVGKVTKDFVDCGGVRRSETACVLQTLVAHDTEHRLSAPRLAGILSKTSTLGLADDLPVDIEIQGKSIETWRVASIVGESDRMVIHVAPKRTACLAQDKCGLDVLPIAAGGCCDSQSNCC